MVDGVRTNIGGRKTILERAVKEYTMHRTQRKGNKLHHRGKLDLRHKSVPYNNGVAQRWEKFLVAQNILHAW